MTRSASVLSPVSDRTVRGLESEFEAVPESARLVRGFLRRVLADRVDVDVDLVVLFASELAANAIVHARTTFVVRVEPADDGVEVSVLDASPDLPRAAGTALEAVKTSGRGLDMIAAGASDWGFEISSWEKRVWFQIRTSSNP